MSEGDGDGVREPRMADAIVGDEWHEFDMQCDDDQSCLAEGRADLLWLVSQASTGRLEMGRRRTKTAGSDNVRGNGWTAQTPEKGTSVEYNNAIV